MNRAFAGRWLPYVVPVSLLVAAALLVALQASRPLAVLDMWRPWGEIGALAVVMTAIILTGGIDLSVGSIVALSSVVMGLTWQAGWSLGTSMATGLLAGLAAGVTNGTLVVIGIAPLVVTLATMASFAGLAMALSRGERIAGLPEQFAALGQASWWGVPTQFMLFVLVGVAGWCVVHHTRYGRYLYAIGENREAAKFAAVPVRMVQWSLYTASGAVAALVAVVYTARGGAVVPTAGAGLELPTIACVVVGGTRVTGGRGGIGRTLTGVAILSLLDIGLQFLSGDVRVPWSDVPWRFSANTRLLLIGLLVIGVAVWNERATRQAATTT